MYIHIFYYNEEVRKKEANIFCIYIIFLQKREILFNILLSDKCYLYPCNWGMLGFLLGKVIQNCKMRRTGPSFNWTSCVLLFRWYGFFLEANYWESNIFQPKLWHSLKKKHKFPSFHIVLGRCVARDILRQDILHSEMFFLGKSHRY